MNATLSAPATVAWIISRDRPTRDVIERVFLDRGFDAACDALRDRFGWEEILSGFWDLREKIDDGSLKQVGS